MDNANFSVDIRIWINSEKAPFAGKGKIQLLEKVQEFGSLTKAAAALKIPYRQAWVKIHDMNNAYNVPVVIFKKGGKEHGTSEVTEFGEKVISAFKHLESDLEKFLSEQSVKINFEITKK